MLFTVPSRYWFPIGRRPYLALGGGRPSFPPDSACPVVLTYCPTCRLPGRLRDSHPLRSAVPVPFGSTQTARRANGDSAPDTPFYPEPAARPRSYADPVWAPPVSLAATPGILSLPRGTEMFQFPRSPHGHAAVSPRSPGRGCPIRIPLDHPLPARPQGLSRRGRVLHRPPAPRHPPCAHHRGFISCRLAATPRSRAGAATSRSVVLPCMRLAPRSCGCVVGWSRGDSNPGPPPCKGGALPAKLRPLAAQPSPAPSVGAPGLEPGTSVLSGPRSHHLSYAPAARPRGRRRRSEATRACDPFPTARSPGGAPRSTSRSAWSTVPRTDTRAGSLRIALTISRSSLERR